MGAGAGVATGAEMGVGGTMSVNGAAPGAGVGIEPELAWIGGSVDLGCREEINGIALRLVKLSSKL